MIIGITDINDQRITEYTGLTVASSAKRLHDNGLFVAETLTVIENAVKAGCKPVSFLLERKHISGKAKALTEAYKDIPFYTADEDTITGMTGYNLTRGILSVMKRPAAYKVSEMLKSAKRVAVLCDIADPANTGAIFRSASALGVDCIIINENCCDPLQRRAVRVSMGTIFTIPWAVCKSPVDTLKGSGFTTIALAIDSKAEKLGSGHLSDISKAAFFFGNEGAGLSTDIISGCDRTVYIPMRHGVDSLNVAASAAIVFWQLCT